MITRRNFIKSTAILGAGIGAAAFSVPLMAHDGQALYSTTHPEVCGPPRPVQDLSEGALEDFLVDHRLTDNDCWWISPHYNDDEFTWFERLSS